MAPKVHTHPHDSALLALVLKNALPYSINLAYRIQHPNRTPDAHILATFPVAQGGGEVPKCWAAAYIDRSMRPETELWIFAAGEIPGHMNHNPESHDIKESNFCPTCKTATLSLLDHMSTLPTPPLHPSNLFAMELAKQHEIDHPETGPDVRYPSSRKAYYRHLLDPNAVVTVGACHEKLVQICVEAGIVRDEFPGRQARLDKFIFKVADLSETRKLPQGLRWGEMTEKDINDIQSRAEVPRTTRTLLTMKGVGVFEEQTNRPVAWAFLGLDGSLVFLHTEPEYRGMGIAKAIGTRIFGQHGPALAVDEAGNAWANADVYEGNEQSGSVCRSLGGRPLWKTFWIRIDLSRAGRLVQGI